MTGGILYRMIAWFPGAFGFLLRQKLFPRLFRSCGRGVIFGRFLQFVNPQNIEIGDNCVISGRCSIAAGKDAFSGSIILEDDVFIGTQTSLFAEKGNIRIEEGANLGSCCTIVSTSSVVVGRDALFAAFCEVGSLDTLKKKGEVSGDLIIGDDVWLGARCTVRPGVNIGQSSIIGAHARVITDIEKFSIAIGSPASVIRRRKEQI